MTNKSLSQQICEACGIEPKKDCTNCSHPCEVACNNCSDGELVYPDFENHANLQKLFRMLTTLEDFAFCTGLYLIPQKTSYRRFSCLSTSEGEYESENIDPVKAFLTCVFKCVVEEKDTADYIRQEKWEV